MDFELAGNYPIIIDGKETGTIDVSRDGLFWCFEASSEMDSGIIRLSVFGDEAEGYLGVMEPSGDRLRLKKKLSRNALSGFPRSITHGGLRGSRVNQARREESPPAPPPEEEAPSADEKPSPAAKPPAPVAETKAASPAPVKGEGNAPSSPEKAKAADKKEASPPALKQEPQMIVHRPSQPPKKQDTQNQPRQAKPKSPQTAAAPPKSAPSQEGAGGSKSAAAPKAKSAAAESKAAEPKAAQSAEKAQASKSPPAPEKTAAEKSALVWKMCGTPAAYLSTMIGKNLFGAQSNVLEATDGEHIYLAIPEETAELSDAQRKLFSSDAIIMGDKHLICKIKNGIIV